MRAEDVDVGAAPPKPYRAESAPNASSNLLFALLASLSARAPSLFARASFSDFRCFFRLAFLSFSFSVGDGDNDCDDGRFHVGAGDPHPKPKCAWNAPNAAS